MSVIINCQKLLRTAYNSTPNLNEFTSGEFEVFDWGCGQGIATVCLLDHFKNLRIRKVTLVEPSTLAVDRGKFVINCIDSNIKVSVVNKKFDELSETDFKYTDLPKIHLFSDILDVTDFDMQEFISLFQKVFVGENLFFCVGPYYDNSDRLDEFMAGIDPDNAFGCYDKYDWINGWTISLRVFIKDFNEDEVESIDVIRERIEHINKNRRSPLTPCSKCGGTGYVGDDTCSRCGGLGYEEFFDADTYDDDKIIFSSIGPKIIPILERYARWNSHSKLILAKCYYYGSGVKKDYRKSSELFGQLSEQKNTVAQYYLGKCYYYGYGKKKSFRRAVDVFNKAAEKNYHKAQYFLGKCYFYGFGVGQDYEEAKKLFKKAAKQYDEKAQYFLGKCYYYGLGTEKNYEKAKKYFKKAANKGNDKAQYYGKCYLKGRGVAKSDEKAKKWLKKSSQKGNNRTKRLLGTLNSAD